MNITARLFFHRSWLIGCLVLWMFGGTQVLHGQVLPAIPGISSIQRISYGYALIDSLPRNQFPRGGSYTAVIQGVALDKVNGFVSSNPNVSGSITSASFNSVTVQISSTPVKENDTVDAPIPFVGFALLIPFVGSVASGPVTFDIVIGPPTQITSFTVSNGVTLIPAGTPTTVTYSVKALWAGNNQFWYIGCGSCVGTFGTFTGDQFSVSFSFTTVVTVANTTDTIFSVVVGGVDGSGQGGTTGTDPLSPATLKIPILQVKTELLDPVSSLLSNGSLTSDYNVLASQGIPVQGTATDGVARLILRVSATCGGTPCPGTATFSLVDNGGQSLPANQENGTVEDLQAGQIGQAVTVPTTSTNQGDNAFAIFLAPSQFVRASVPADQSAAQRQVFMDVKFTPPGGQPFDFGLSQINLIRPMVFLVHGVWSSASAWNTFGALAGTVGSPTADPRFYVQRADYGWIADHGFSAVAPVVYDQLKVYLDFYKQDNNVAAVQADVVTHSMGGPVVRTMALAPTFLNDSTFPTFGAGPIRKLITVAGVHQGTPIATFILPPAGNTTCLAEIFSLIGNNPFNGAVADLKPSSSAISAINSARTPFPAHTIVGITDVISKQGVENWFNTIGTALCPIGSITPWIHLDLTSVYSGHANDLLVSDSSQTGFDVAATATDTVQGVVHSFPFDILGGFPFDPYETESISIVNIVVALLDINTNNGVFWQPLPR